MGEMIKIWGIGDAYPLNMLAKHLDDSIFDYLKLLDGTRIDNVVSYNISMKCNPKKLLSYDVLFTEKRIPLVSHKIIEEINSVAGNSVQFIQAFIDLGNVLVSDYWIMNITNLVEIVNLEKSNYIPISGTDIPERFIDICCNNQSLDESLIARDVNCRAAIFVNETLFTRLIHISRNRLCFYEPSYFFK